MRSLSLVVALALAAFPGPSFAQAAGPSAAPSPAAAPTAPVVAPSAGGPPAPAPEAPPLYTPARVEAELAALAERHPGVVRVERYGASHEGRPLLVARLGPPGRAPKPLLVALFGQHPDEHDMNALGMAFVRALAAGQRADPRIKALLDRCEVAVVPMANPDGVAYDLGAAPRPFTWRGNRRPREGGVGTNLNRNWGGDWKPGTPADWPGEAPFSEPESRALRDWLGRQRAVLGFFDYHSGASGFSQGMVLLPEPGLASGRDLARHARLAQAMADRMALPGDAREPFWVLPPSGVRAALIGAMSRHVPEAHRDAAIASVPTDTRAWGTAIGWALTELRATSFGLELSRPFDFPDPDAYARALEADYATRVPRYLDGFLAAAAALASVGGEP